MKQEILDAKNLLAHALWDWPEHYDTDHVRTAIMVLLEAAGGRAWTDAHPRYRNPPERILHAAGMRIGEVMDSLSTCVRMYDADLFFCPSDIRLLCSIVC